MKDEQMDALMERNRSIIVKCEEKGEPYFVLRAQDKLAAEIVFEWCNHAKEAGVEAALVEHAKTIGRAMQAWPVKKVPD